MTTTTYLWDTESDNLLSEDDGTSAMTYTNEPTQFGDLISQNNSLTSNANFYHFDARGDTRELTRDAEVVTDTRLYDAWGNVIGSSGSTAMPFQFIGQLGYVFDGVLNLNYVRARWYQQEVGRWMSQDPLGFVDNDNLFVYGLNQPNTHVDPGGERVLIAAWEGTGANAGVSDKMMAGHYVPNAISFLQGRGVPAEQLLIGGQHVFPVANVALDVADAYRIARAAKTVEPDCPCCYPRLVLIGFSYGAQTALDVAALLGPLGVTPSLLFTIDPVDKVDPYNLRNRVENVQATTSNWCRATNVYQRTATGLIGFQGNNLAGMQNFRVGPDDLNRKPLLPGGGKYPRNSNQHHNLISYLKKVHNKWLADLSYYSSTTGVSRDSATMCGVTDVCWHCGLNI